MKRNLYTNHIENIKAPESLVNKSIARLSTYQTESEVIMIKPKSHKAFKFASIIAATLVILIGVGIFTFSDKETVEHPFILTVGAEEITANAYIKVGNTTNLDYFQNITLHGYLDENRNFVQTDNFADLNDVSKEFNVGINCEGENIESVTYKAINGCLAYQEDYPGLIKITPLTTDEIMKYDATGSYNKFKWASDCTFDYNDQPRATYTELTGLEVPADAVDGTVPLRILFHFEFEEGEYVLPIDEEYNVDSDHAFQKEFNEHADEFGLYVTANFKDGTSTTKTLRFKCESDDYHLYLSAMEDIS